MSKARSISKLTPATSGVVSIAGTAALKVPVGTTAERPSGEVGLVRYNTTSGSTEVYNQSTGWSSIGSPPPTITSVSPVTYNGESGTSFTINGSNFTSDAIIKFITNNGTEYTAATVTFANVSQIIATTPQDFTVAQEPLDVKLIQASGTTTLVDCIDCGGTPTWITAAGNIKTIYDSLRNTTLQVTATDPDSNATISYSVVSGALPTGMTLNSSTGAITGTASAVVSDTTYNFTIRATDNAGNTSDRAFSSLVKAPVTQIFSYTGSDQTWTAPAGLTSATVYVWGAGGSSGNGSNTPGGSGGYAEGIWSVTAGNTYTIVVGQGGDLPATTGSGGGGGGLSGIFNTSATVFTDGTPTAGMQSNAIIIAGGGGGGAGGNSDNNGTYGGAGGGTTGGTGRADTRSGNPVTPGSMNGGGGGTQSAGGAFALDTGGGFGDPTAGIALQGGKAAVQAGNRSYRYGGGGPGSNSYNGSYAGGGGGGGYYGGGGGSDYYSSGGGGGSGYIGGVTSGVNTQGNTSTSANASAPNVANASNSNIGLGGAGGNTAGGNGEVRIKY